MRTLYPSHTQVYIGKGHFLYCGPLQHLEAHVYGAAVLHVGVYRPFRIKLAGADWQTCRCVVIPAGIRHALDMGGGVHGKLFVERDSLGFGGFSRRFSGGNTAVCFEDAQIIEFFRWFCEEDPGHEALEQRLDCLLDVGLHQPLAFDARIQHIIQTLAKEPDRNFSQLELAAMIGLSPSRFLHLFRQHAGVPYRRFRMWKRLLNSIALLYASDSLTRSALDAGFADAAHFSHCFRDTFGVNPAPVFRKIERFELAPALLR